MQIPTLPFRAGGYRGAEATTVVRKATAPAPPAPLQPVTFQVAHYAVECPLGTGGQGEVFAAWDTQLLRPVALKRLRHRNAADIAAHLEEARRSAGLRHAAFVRIHGVINDAQGEWIVMERVYGQELSAVIRQGPMAAVQAVRLMAQAAHALTEVHRSGLAHGDIKPSNLMLQPGGDLRILDFGIAHAFSQNVAAADPGQAPAGTLAYMAPERIRGEPPGPASDIFALGAVFLELLGGRRPRPAHRSETTASLGSAAWELPEMLPAELARLILAMGEADAARRPTDMETLASALDELGAALAGGPVAPRWFQRHGLAVRAMAAALLCAALLPSDAWRSPALAAGSVVQSSPQHLRDGIEALRHFDEDGAIDRAVRHFQAVTQRTPQHAAGLAWLALAWCTSYRNGAHDESLLPRAREAAERAVALDGQLAAGYAAQGWAHELQGDRTAARQHYAQALRLDPDNLYAVNGQVRLLAAQGRYEEALAMTAAARTRHPGERLFADLQGWLHFERGDMAAAERAFRESIQVQPDAVFAYANLNATLLRQGRTDEALHVLQQGLQVRPAGRLYTNLGAALYARGDYAAAATAFRAAAEGPYGSPRFYLRWANLADALRWVPGERDASAAAYRKALDLLRPALAREPTPANLSRAALYEARAGLRDEAQAHLAELRRRPPEQSDPQLRMALAYETLGLRAQAIESLRRALSLGYPPALAASEPEFAELHRDPAFTTSIHPFPEEARHVVRVARQ